jgi:hypothetical protein
MNKDKIKSFLATVAPTLATALGGPLAGVATRAIAGKILGDETASYEQVETALMGASAPDLVKLKELELEFQAQLKEADIKLEKIAADDRNSARDRQVKLKDRTPAILGLSIIIGFFGVLAYLFKYGLPETGSEVLLIMVGSLGMMTSQVGNYFFGSSAGSKTKDITIADLKGSIK